ncbi:response regulator [Rhodospirillaceae bacterium KN72]|uniref:Response regulator n=1 Tax=Pacificispira spongiicola TaxID=2729598 RepID=A0A7Y0E1N6_9PROT|nr:HD domain-containing phosphohydrolase [Pacificispira spongiicola]NMM45619.1 response regulator [Pacificispira spongiicola]
MGKVLFVDDDPNLLAGIRRQFQRRYDIDFAGGGKAALEKLHSAGPFAVVVSDMRMPEMDGVEFLSTVAQEHPDAIRIMLTGNTDQKTAIDAVNRGHVFNFLNKPCETTVMTAAIDNALTQFKLRSMERDLLEKTLAGSVKVLLDVLRVINPIAYSRSNLLQPLAARIAADLGAPNIWEIKIATMLAAIGWMSVPEVILEKLFRHRPLGPEEQILVDRQPEVAYELIKSVPRLEGVARIIRFQNKNFDGTGAPESIALAEEDIPLGSRILKVLNAATPMDRTRRPSLAQLEKMEKSERVYDPVVLMMTRSVLEEFRETDLQEPVTVIEVQVGRLLPGDILEEDLTAPDGSLLLSAGSELSEFHIVKLRHDPKYPELSGTVPVTRYFG